MEQTAKVMKLYYAPGTCALACWISLEWAGAKYEVEKVNPSGKEYRMVNPLGMVPALDIGGKRPMTQSDAILQYIAARYNEKDLGASEGLENQFEFHEIMAFLTGDFHPAFWPYFSPQRYTVLNDKSSLEAVKSASYKRVDRVMTHLDDLVRNKTFVYQNKRTVADAYAYVMARWSKNLPKTFNDYNNLARFMDKLDSDPAVQKVLRLSTM